ncbi:ABC transporter substrate-binding protein [Arthrobacter sp. MMS24-S77]
MSKPKSLAGAASLVAAALILSACSGGSGGTNNGVQALKADLNNLATTTTPGTEPVDKVKWNLPYEPMSLDPMHSFNYAENTVIANMCESLVRMKPDLSTEPGLAESVTTPNDTTVIYKIRAGVKFWDGSPLTADDVAFSIQRQVGSSSTSYFGFYFSNVSSVGVTGDREVTVKLKSPDARFGQAMASAAGAIVKRSAVEAAGADFGTPKGGIQCTGPFSLDAWQAGKSIELKKNPNYWNAQLMPHAERVSFSFIADESTAINALRSGDVDGQFFYLPPTGLSQLANNDKVTTTYGKSLVFFALAGASEDGPFADPRVRQAILSVIDRKAIADVVFQGAAIPAATLAGPDYWANEKDTFKQAADKFSTAPDIEAAKKLVTAVGPITKPIVLGVQSSSAVHEQTANLIQAAAASIGLKVETKVIPVEQFGNLYRDPAARKGLDGFFTTWYGNYSDPIDIYQVFRKGDPNNFNNYTAADALVNKAIGTLDNAERAKITVQAQELVTRDAAWLPLTYEPTTLVQSKHISGATASIGYLYFPWAATIGGVK